MIPESRDPARVALAPEYEISRLINGCWQLSRGHDPEAESERDVLWRLHELFDGGRTTFDCADIYTGVEELLGKFRREVIARTGDAEAVQIHTKCVPDLSALPTLERRQVEATIDRSLRRLGVERLDLVQFCWWDFTIPGFVECAGWLDAMRRAGKIRCLGLTNTDAAHTAELTGAGIPVLANQVQYSLLDRRPAAERGRGSLPWIAYGTLAGGLLGERWLGAERPDAAAINRSLVKYLLILDEVGGWDALQRLLDELREIAAAHEVTIADVAVRWVLDQPGVLAVTLGTSGRAHRLAPFAFELTDGERAALERALPPSPPGGVYELERDRDGPHGRIMRYELNREGAAEGRLASPTRHFMRPS